MDLFCCCSKIQDNRRRRRPYGSFSLSSTSSIATLPRLSGVTYEPPFVPPSGKLPVFDEFDLLCLIGKGSFGKVFLVEHGASNRIFALKAVAKAKINTDKQIQQILAEVDILKQLRHPNCITLHCTFQDEYFLYFAFNFVPGGSLQFHLRQMEKFQESVARFYLAEVILALEYLHSLNIIYRDLKPENCMLSQEGHVVLVDFGSSKKLEERERTNTFVGTPHYMAPEVLRGQPYDFSADWWGLGVLLFELLTGHTPFVADDRIQLYRNVLRGKVDYPASISPRARDLLMKLIERNSDVRLGRTLFVDDVEISAQEIRTHSFFSTKSISEEELMHYTQHYSETKPTLLESNAGTSWKNSMVTKLKRFTAKSRSGGQTFLYEGEPNSWTWEQMVCREVKPPLKPRLNNERDTRFFDTSITAEPRSLNDQPRCFKPYKIENFDYLLSADLTEPNEI